MKASFFVLFICLNLFADGSDCVSSAEFISKNSSITNDRKFIEYYYQNWSSVYANDIVEYVSKITNPESSDRIIIDFYHRFSSSFTGKDQEVLLKAIRLDRNYRYLHNTIIYDTRKLSIKR